MVPRLTKGEDKMKKHTLLIEGSAAEIEVAKQAIKDFRRNNRPVPQLTSKHRREISSKLFDRALALSTELRRVVRVIEREADRLEDLQDRNLNSSDQKWLDRYDNRLCNFLDKLPEYR